MVKRFLWHAQDLGEENLNSFFISALVDMGKSIGFDIDFSSPSNPADDAAFAAALERVGGTTYLATLSQAL